MPQRILFVHQNFPGQFGHVAQELARRGHEVVALGILSRAVPGVRALRYPIKPPEQPSTVEPVRDFETKVVRGLACAQAMNKLREEGFAPDVVVAHPGWGEALFCKDVFPAARLVLFAEFFYSAEGADFGFDPEFARDDLQARMRLRLRNSALLQALHGADGGYTPTRWQHAQLPAPYRSRFEVIFDGIDTAAARPDPGAWLALQKAGVRLAAGDEVLTFVNRNLEPYRGFHVFMRALPAILRARPQARVLMIGGNDVSYGSRPAGGGNWRQRLLAELGERHPKGWGQERVHFLGRVPYRDYLRVLQVSRCHVYLTYPFVLSWSCVEAMSAGCTLVASRTAPVQEFVEHGREGLLVDFFDVEGLARQVIEVLTRPSDFAHLGPQARARVVEHYDLASRCLPALCELVLGGSAPSALPDPAVLGVATN
jgi:glycosyltransferase involved in cell wall biosynthesis